MVPLQSTFPPPPPQQQPTLSYSNVSTSVESIRQTLELARRSVGQSSTTTSATPAEAASEPPPPAIIQRRNPVYPALVRVDPVARQSPVRSGVQGVVVMPPQPQQSSNNVSCSVASIAATLALGRQAVDHSPRNIYTQEETRNQVDDSVSARLPSTNETTALPPQEDATTTTTTSDTPSIPAEKERISPIQEQALIQGSAPFASPRSTTTTTTTSVVDSTTTTMTSTPSPHVQAHRMSSGKKRKERIAMPTLASNVHFSTIHQSDDNDESESKRKRS